MLSTWKIMPFVGTTNAERSRAFYSGKLGLELIEESPFALVYNANGTILRVTLVNDFRPAGFTVLGWQAPDIEEAVRTLRAAGIEPKRYENVPQDANGVWTAPGGAKVIWFEDPDQNVLSVSQH